MYNLITHETWPEGISVVDEVIVFASLIFGPNETNAYLLCRHLLGYLSIRIERHVLNFD